VLTNIKAYFMSNDFSKNGAIYELAIGNTADPRW